MSNTGGGGTSFPGVGVGVTFSSVVGVGVGVSTFSGGGHFFSQSSSSFKSFAIFSLRITCALFPLFPLSFASLAEFPLVSSEPLFHRLSAVRAHLLPH